MKLHLDATKCQAYGLCKDEAPDLVDLDDWGYAATVRRDLTEDEMSEAQEAVAVCPVKALRLLNAD